MKRFSKAYGKPVKYESVSPSLLDRHSDLPTELLNLWNEHGFAVYRRGLLWFTNPDEFEGIVKSIYGEDSTYRCIARSAFGDLILYSSEDEGRFAFFAALTLRTTAFSGHYEIFFDYTMSRKEWLRDVMLIRDYKRVLKKLGPLESDQIYAFEPHPALGGSGEGDTLEKRRIFEYLHLLSQLME